MPVVTNYEKTFTETTFEDGTIITNETIRNEDVKFKFPEFMVIYTLIILILFCEIALVIDSSDYETRSPELLSCEKGDFKLLETCIKDDKDILSMNVFKSFNRSIIFTGLSYSIIQIVFPLIGLYFSDPIYVRTYNIELRNCEKFKRKMFDAFFLMLVCIVFLIDFITGSLVVDIVTDGELYCTQLEKSYNYSLAHKEFKDMYSSEDFSDTQTCMKDFRSVPYIYTFYQLLTFIEMCLIMYFARKFKLRNRSPYTRIDANRQNNNV